MQRIQQLNLEFIFFVVAALFLSAIPYANIPFTWFSTFFHEISHGLAALATGGAIIKIDLHLQGSGLCYTSGGSRFFILNGGYIGAVVSGILIYKMADSLSHRKTNILAIFLAGLIALTAILWARDLTTWAILLILFVLFLGIIKLQDTKMVKWALKFIGIYVLVNAVRSPLYLIDGQSCGDGASLSNLTHIPEIFWVALWFVIGICGVLYLWLSRKKSKFPS